MKGLTAFASALTAAGLLFAVPTAAYADAHTATEQTSNTIAGIASTNDSFDVLTALLKRAELVGVLNGDTEFTVFAPTDAAFGRLPAGTIESLFQPENKALLATVLTYHVVPGSIRSTDLSAGSVDSVAEIPLDIAVSPGVTVNSANVVEADIEASNGIIHVIDQVLLPPQ
ncbi:MAG: fasciclin domain-containing protein [Leptolyngbya sp. SIO1E4]|nr:fasciclin domain-containing protein [Leptolyngbya sp. SIO1E4]